MQKLATDNTATGFHPTMYPYSSAYNGSSKVDITGTGGTSLNFAVLNLTAAQTANPAFLQTITANDPTAKFVVFGIGPRCSMVGQTIHEAPTSVPQNKQLTPDTTYSRFGAIFMIAGAEVSRTERARFIATVALEDDELELAEKDIVGYYGVARDPRQ